MLIPTRFLTLLFSLCFALCTYAQDTLSFAGLWRGELTQIEGGFTDKYHFEIFLEPGATDGTLSGRSYVQALNIEGVMTTAGPIRGKMCYLTEGDVLRSRKPTNMAWCIKTMQLRLTKREGEWWLEGPWQGVSEYGSCPPGMVRLKKIVPRV
ncbi:MAG: hypothetical protein AAGJ82_01930 [Bacteroidota bacterium]